MHQLEGGSFCASYEITIERVLVGMADKPLRLKVAPSLGTARAWNDAYSKLN